MKGKYRLFLGLATCQFLKVYDTLKISYLSYIASIHKLSWFLLAKGQAEYQGPWAFCCAEWIYNKAIN